MSTLLLNSPADHASRAFVDQKTARPDQVPLLVDHHHFGETETFHQQASGAKNQKNSEHFAHYLLTILTRREREARARRADKRAPPMQHRLGRLLQSSCCPPLPVT
jgi:hypothetical protein